MGKYLAIVLCFRLQGSCAQLGNGQPISDGSTLPSDPTTVPPIIEKVLLKHVKDVGELVFFDLETTGFEMDCDIVQLSAMVGSKQFNQYVLPTKPIAWQASDITGITCKDGSLYHHKKKVEAVTQEKALQLFVNWLTSNKHVTLVAHNCYLFDSKRLLGVARRHGVEASLNSVVGGFIDTLPLFKKIYPNLENYKQVTVVANMLKETYEAHDALQDVKALQKLVTKNQDIEFDILQEYSFSLQSLRELMDYEEKGRHRAKTLNPLVISGSLSSEMAKTIGKSGLHFEHLKAAFAKGGRDRMIEILTQPDRNGKPRATSRKAIIEKICHFFAESQTALCIRIAQQTLY